MNYKNFTKTQLIKIAKDRAIPRYSVVARKSGTKDLIAMLKEWDKDNSAPTQKPPISFSSIPTPKNFFELVKGLDSRERVEQACQALLDILNKKFATSTVSARLTAYKKLFYNFTHSNPELNEEVTIKLGTEEEEKKLQHIAGNLLRLSDKQLKELGQERGKSEQSRRGIDKSGELRQVELSPQKIQVIVDKASNLLASDKAVEIACGLLPLTGLRKNEQNMPAIEYDSRVVEREWKVVGENLLAVKGLSKKDGDTSWYVRPTLIPAMTVVEAQERFLSFKEVQNIGSNYNAYNNGSFRKKMDRSFKSIWDKELSTIEAYDDSGRQVGNNASTHKARAFYVWSLIPVLKSSGFKQKQASLYLQNCLGHEDEKDTSKYFNRYDEDAFTEAIDINIPKNIKEVGQISAINVEQMNKAYLESVKGEEKEQASDSKVEEKVEKQETKTAKTKEKVMQTKQKPVKKETEVKQTSDFDINQFIKAIPVDYQSQFQTLIEENRADVTNVLLEMFKIIVENSNQKPNKNRAEVPQKVEEIIAAVMEYNEAQTETKSMLVPLYAACNRISKTVFGKEFARSTYEDIWKKKGVDIVERLEKLGIPNISRADAKAQGIASQDMHNGKYHRKDMDEVVGKVIELMDVQGEE